MRGYGRSSVYGKHDDYAQELIVRDMIELLDSTGRAKAVWVGHDWGSPVVWNVASHYPDRCEAVASLCVPYFTIDRGLEHTLTLVDRKLYPESEFPYGQWEYMRFYEENFAAATDPMDANVRKFLKLAFRKGDPSGEHKRAATSMARKGRGLFGSAEIPDVPRDGDVITEEDLSVYTSALERNGFFGPSSWYMNHKTNEAYGAKAANDGNLDMLLTSNNGPARLLHNDGGNGNAWLTIRLIGRKCNREGIGAEVRVQAGGRTQRDQVRSGSSYLSASDLRLHFGLGRARQADRVEVHWPGGGMDRLDAVPIDRVLEITEGQTR